MPTMNTPGVKALDIWDVLIAQIVTPASIGELLDDTIVTRQFTLYEYGPTSLANLGNYVPPANTLVLQAMLKAATVDAVNEFFWEDLGQAEVLFDAFLMAQTNNKTVMTVPVVCDGTNVRLRNSTGLAKDLHLRGLSIA